MRFFLHAFSAMRHDQHCLAFAFTYRETSDFQGIAWIKGHNPEDLRTMHHFGYCAKDDAEHCQIMRDHRRDSKYAKMGTWPQHYFRNTGVVNLHLVQGLLSKNLPSIYSFMNCDIVLEQNMTMSQLSVQI